MTAGLGDSSPRSARPSGPTGTTRTAIPVRRAYSTPLQAVRRRQEALEQLAARRMTPPPRHVPGLGAARIAPPAAPATPTVPLTAREIEVLRTWLLVDSKSDAADQLNISVGTVNTHLARIRAKYIDAGRPARTKASLVARAIQDGLVVLEEL
ncbi:MAG: LuxR C-terminal-related transcriptional regulator [Gordonia sp. (in: high G+C Gram-positive bacteria)]